MPQSTASQAQYAAHRGVSRKTVTTWKQKGLLVLTPAGQVDVEATDRLLLDHGNIRPQVTKGNTPVVADAREETPEEAAERIIVAEGRAPHSKVEAERIKENYLALLRQLEYDRAAGSVAEIDDFVVAVVSEYATVRNKLLGIGSKVAHRISVMKSPDEVKALIDREVAQALEELSLDGQGRRSTNELQRDIQDKFSPAS